SLPSYAPSCASPSFPTRRSSDLIAVQTMLNIPVEDIAGNVAQARRVAAAGCQIVRVTVPTPADAAVVSAIKEAVEIPVVESQPLDRKSTRLNSSHVSSSYAVFCL